MVKIGVFGTGKKELCPLCLEEVKKSVHHQCSPQGSVLVKREGYALVRVLRNEPVVERMLSITNNKNDVSKNFIVLYVDKTLVGYKGRKRVKFISGFSKEEYKDILREYVPRSERVKKTFETPWGDSGLLNKMNY